MLRSSSPHKNNLNHHHHEESSSSSYYTTMPTTTTTQQRSCSPLHFLNPGNLNLKSSPSSSSSSASSSHHKHLSLLPSSHSLPSLKSCPPSSSSRTQKPRHRKMHKAASSSSSAGGAAANEDVSRLLDPAYQTHSYSSYYTNNGYNTTQRRSPTTVTAYVDAEGEVHDPDYRDFPLTSSASSSPTRASYHHHHLHSNQHRTNIRSMSSSSSSSSPNNVNPHRQQLQKRRRPQFDWEIELDENALLDDEYGVGAYAGSSADDYYPLKHYQPRYVSTNTASWTSAPTPSGYTYAQYAEQAKQGVGYRPRDNSISTTGTTSTGATTATTTTTTMYSPTGTASTLPTSYEDDESPIGLVVDVKKEEKKEKVKGRKLAKRNSEKERAIKLAAEKERVAEEARMLAEREKEKEKEAQRLREEEEEEAAAAIQSATAALQRRRRSTGSYDLEKRAVISHTTTASPSSASHRHTNGAAASTTAHVYVPARSSFSRTRGTRRTRMIDALEMEDALRLDLEDEKARREEEAEEAEREKEKEKARRRKSSDGRCTSVRASGEYPRSTAVFEEEEEEEQNEEAQATCALDESSSHLHHHRRSLSIHLPRCPSARSKHAPKSSSMYNEKTTVGAGAGDEYVPTCGQSLKRQWQALALSVRFGVFRAQRRVMRRVASVVN